MSAIVAEKNESSQNTLTMPSEKTLNNSVKLAIVEDKPLMFDYWNDSVEGKVLIGVKDDGEKMLVRSSDEYTSPISKFYKSINEYIIITANSIYIVHNSIPTRKIQ